MKLVIVGPDGSGKTVFLAMLGSYVQEHAKDLQMQPKDFATAEYVATARTAMADGNWPPSTVTGQLHRLFWRIGIQSKKHELEMLDCDGKQLRKVLKNLPEVETNPEMLAIRQHLDAANTMLFFLNLEDFISETRENAPGENAFLLSAFLDNSRWRSKSRAVVVTKIDQYASLLDATHDLKSVLLDQVRHLPELCGTIEQANVPFIPVSSVVTEIVHQDGMLFSVPKAPLTAGDMKLITSYIRKQLGQFRFRRMLMNVGAAVLGLSLAAGALLFWREYNAFTYQVTFKTHDHVPDPLDPDKPVEVQKSLELGFPAHKEGTDAIVTLTIYGEEGKSDTLTFNGLKPSASSKDAFETGQVDTFNNLRASRVGKIQSVNVAHDDSKRGGWHLDFIEVKQFRYGVLLSTTTFPYYNWLSNDRGGCAKPLRPGPAS